MKRWIAILNIVLFSTAAVLVLQNWVDSSTPAIARRVLAARPAATSPTLSGIAPNSASNDMDNQVVITGADFLTAELSSSVVHTSPTAYLGTTLLKDVTWVDGATLDATIPWGLKAGVYTLTLVNPDGGMGSLPNAFTATEAVNTWTTSGPFGGNVSYLLVNPITPTTLYAAGNNSGVFVSNDSGGHWQQILIDDFPLRQAIDPNDPRVLYVGGHFGLNRSLDGGTTWQYITPQPDGCIQFCTPAVHLSLPGVVYVATGADPWSPQPGQEGSIYRSDNYGSTWITRSAGLTDTQVTALAFYPDNPDHMVAGTRDGNIFVTNNGGVLWRWTARVGSHVEQLYVNPFGAHEVWIAAQMPFWPRKAPYLYRSSDPGLTTWSPVTLMNNGNEQDILSVTFHPTISGTMWAAGGNGYKSTDGGATWTQLNGQLHGGANVIAVDISHSLIYAGTFFGLFKSLDDGDHWIEAINGLAAVTPDAVASVPAQPDEVYASTGALGVLKSTNGGRNWRELGISRQGVDWQQSSLAVDPITPTRVYLGEQCYAGPCMRISANGGQEWHAISFTLPITWSGWGGEVFAVAPNPRISGRVLAGATFYPPDFDWSNPSRPVGGIYISADAGEHFTYRPTAPISGVVQFAYDSINPNLVYAATEGTGLWRSTDGGFTWEQAASWGSSGEIWSVVADPWQPNTVWIGKWQLEASLTSVFSSADAGHTWIPVSWPKWDRFGIRTLLFAPTTPSTLYIGTGGAGLYRTHDSGQNWELVPGLPDNGNFGALAASSDGERVAVYVGTAGGTTTNSAATDAIRADGSLSHSPASSTLMNAGVYRQITRQLMYRMVLPVVSLAGTH